MITLLSGPAHGKYPQGKYEEAEPIYDRVISILALSVGDQHPHYASVLHNKAGMLRGQVRRTNFVLSS